MHRHQSKRKKHPAIIAPPPVEAEEAPAIIAPPPVEAEEAPAIIAPPPVEAEETPAIIAPPPVEAEEAPAIIAPPPVEAEEAPAIIAPPPVEAEEAPPLASPDVEEPQLVAAPPVFRAPPPPVQESQESGPSQHAPFHPEHEPVEEATTAKPLITTPPATGTTEIDVGQLSLDDDQLDSLGDLGGEGLEPDDFFAPPADAVAEVVTRSTAELAEQVASEPNAELETLAHQIVERVAWEIIPDIVERVVRERLSRED